MNHEEIEQEMIMDFKNIRIRKYDLDSLKRRFKYMISKHKTRGWSCYFDDCEKSCMVIFPEIDVYKGYFSIFGNCPCKKIDPQIILERARIFLIAKEAIRK